MRNKKVFWGSNVNPVHLCGVAIQPKYSKPVEDTADEAVVKVVDYKITALILSCVNCKKVLFDNDTLTSLPAHTCMECVEYDLCEDCFRSDFHSHPMFLNKGVPIEKFGGRETVQECLLHALQIHNTKPMIGAFDNGSLVWYTYTDMYKKIMKFASGLTSLNLEKGSFVGICANNRVEYLIVDYACIILGLVVVPIHVPFGQKEIDYIIESTETKCVICSANVIQKFLDSKKVNKCLEIIIQIESYESAPVNDESVLYFDKILAKGDRRSFVPEPVDPESLFVVCFTSGSTGVPKGVMHKNSSVAQDCSYEFERYYVGVCFAPLAHSARENLIRVFINGGRVAFTSGNMDTILDEIQQVNPTSINAVPRFYNMLYNLYKDEVAALEKADPENAANAEALVATTFSKKLGKNLRIIAAGGAPTGETVLKFLQKVFTVAVVNGYGTTEAGSLAHNERIDSDVRVKLMSWGEYTIEDKPYPRGEICVKTNYMALGYWKDDKSTNESFQDGWFHTGDIGEMYEHDKVKIIDRKKNVFKLAQGEFVAPEHLENIFIGSKFVKQIMVSGLMEKSFLIAIIVPSSDALQEWASQNKITVNDISEIFENKELEKTIISDFMQMGMKAKLPTFQIPRGIYLSSETFTPENGKMTASNKLNRINLEKHFKQTINQIYERIEADSTHGETNGQTDEAVLRRIISQFSPGIESINDPDESIFSVGLDSLSAIQIIHSIKHNFNVDIPLQNFYENPTISGLLTLIRSAKVIDVTDSDVRAFGRHLLDDSELSMDIKPKHNNSEIKEEPEDIFLTGATGFLGAYLLLELLRNTKADIICLVRADDDASAMERIKSNLRYYRLDFEEYCSRIIPVKGDLTLPLLGLEESLFETLSYSVDSIYHCGAKINGLLPYGAHKAHNVDGTIEIIKMAATGKYKQIHYISTISVFKDSSHEEDYSLDRSGYAYIRGYGQSKWVAEQLCIEARARGIPVSIYRFGTISGDSTNGKSHTSDFINRLIGGLAFMKIYPLVDAKVEMTPVDYAAKACIYISLRKENLGKNFHVVNPNLPLSFEELLTYIMKVGYKMKQVPYALWKEAIAKNSKNPLFPLTSYFKGDFPSAEKISCTNTTEALKNSNLICPEPMDECIALYLQAFVEEKIIKEPSL